LINIDSESGSTCIYVVYFQYEDTRML